MQRLREGGSRRCAVKYILGMGGGVGWVPAVNPARSYPVRMD